MLTLSIRTDKPEAELGLYDGQNELGYYKWQAHRALAETIHVKINQLLKSHDKNMGEISGVVFYKGPGSFTGLRIGASVANALAYSLEIPIVGVSGGDWLNSGINQLNSGDNHNQVLPEYGSPAHITQPKK